MHLQSSVGTSRTRGEKGKGSGREEREDESKREEGKKDEGTFCRHQCHYIQKISKYMQMNDIIENYLQR